MFIDKKNLIIIALLLILALFGWYVFGFVLPDQRRGIESIRNELNAATERINNIERGLDASAAEAGRISEGLGDTATSIATVERRIEVSQGRLTESQRILRQVRERGKKGD